MNTLKDVQFLVQKMDNREDYDRLIKSIESKGYEYVLVDEKTEIKHWEYFGEHHEQIANKVNCYSNPVVYFGGLFVARRIQRESGSIPGAICNLDDFKCSHYYCNGWAKHMWNVNPIFLPLGEIDRRFESEFSKKKYFFRPDDGFKTFTGTLLTRTEINWLKQKHTPLSLMCMIDEYEDMGENSREYRFFCDGTKIITCCQYMQDGCLVEDSNVPTPEYWYADFVLKSVKSEGKLPSDGLFTMDIMKRKNVLGVVEINSFSCSGIYACDTDKIVDAAAEYALKVFNED